MVDPEQVARGILGALQDAFVAHDLAAAADLLDEEVVLFGTAAENLDGQDSRDYLARVMAQDGTLRWGWDEVVCVLHEPTALAFAVVGTVGFDDAQGQALGERDAFRLTCVAVNREGKWRLRHFHGSVPQL